MTFWDSAIEQSSELILGLRTGGLLVVAYVLFKKKYYHLHEEYLASLKK